MISSIPWIIISIILYNIIAFTVSAPGDVVYDPYGFDDVRGFERFIRRLQLQVAVGQPF